ncbi:MAG: hypothetical protein WCX90_08815 [Thiohalomonadaceae bacterium]
MPAPCIHYGNQITANCFAAVHFGASKSSVHYFDGVIHINLAIPVLGDSPEMLELWSTNTALQHDTIGPLHIAHNGAFLFGALCLDDTTQLEQTSHDIYKTILAALTAHGYPALLRVWNYFPAITGHELDGERYQLFCSGRHIACNTGPDYETKLPAASALGSHGTGLLLYFLAARDTSMQVENPKQISAFHYPKQYGSRSPSFSRAIIKPWNDVTHFYLSGTAAVRGHASEHPNDSLAQLQLSMDNIRQVLTQTHVQYPKFKQRLEDLSLLKVYLHNQADYLLIRNELEKQLGTDLPVLYLLADVCRKELLVEIEGYSVS